MKIDACPDEELLLPMLAGETLAGSLQTHLDTCADCRQRLEAARGWVETLRGATRPGAATFPAPAERPARIGKYLVVGELDSGGQAKVYRVLHPTLDTVLVIKLGHRPVGPEDDHRHFLVAEGKVLARLEHPNLVRVFDLDFHEDRPFLVLEYVRGSHLGRYATDTKPSPREAAGLVAGVARALAVVHRNGIVHQDVKPKNILVDEQNRPRLIDFGVARLKLAWDDGSDGQWGGTPTYMSPEQARGDTPAIGPRSDLFALGGVLYFLLTGKAPFAGASVEEVMKRAGNCDFDRAALHKPGIPPALAAICLKAMAERPADRYGRAEDLAADLERYITRPARLRRLAFATVACLLLAGLGIWLGTRPAATTPVVPPVAPLSPTLNVQIARGDTYLELQEALPLRTDTDRLQIVARVPAGDRAILLHLDTKGRVRQLAAREAPADGFTRLIFPGQGQVVPFDPGTSGTEFVLVCAAPSADALNDLEELLGSVIPALPKLPPKVTVWLTRDEAHRATGHSFGASEADPVAGVEVKLERLRKRLNERKIPVILGVAFAH